MDKRTLTADESFESRRRVRGALPDDGRQLRNVFNWTSPFEGAGAESKAPSLSAMLQSGQLTPTLQALIDRFGGGDTATAQGALSTIASAQGRTGITKLNSTQTFTGMPPAKFTATLHFRAVKDALTEVRAPVQQLEEWAVPQLLANDSVIANAVKTGGDNGVFQTIYPSVVPQILGLRYGDMNAAARRH
ncbi:hypothetical protein [Caballeronia sp. RCC_10]|uniref:hypothetical protein n=1 Tax=Caballeronia sp. RCC_10 TaxID=3239227 RepID=UPI0035264103